MARKSYTPEQIINKLREAEIMLSQGATLAVIWKKIGVSDCTYYRWRKEYGDMRVDQAHHQDDHHQACELMLSISEMRHFWNRTLLDFQAA